MKRIVTGVLRARLAVLLVIAAAVLVAGRSALGGSSLVAVLRSKRSASSIASMGWLRSPS
jgi:hypothetical protein